MLFDPANEATAFFDAVAAAHPDQLTACGAWRVHELVAHVAAGGAEIARNLTAFNAGGAEAVPATRGIEEREAPYRAMAFDEIHRTMLDGHAALVDALDTALAADPDARTPWTGRQMPISAFASHIRSEFAIHRWDIVGDDFRADEALSDVALTKHAVTALGQSLVARGSASGAHHTVWLVSPHAATIVASPDGLAYADVEPTDDDDVVHGDPAARLLYLWGRQPTRPGRLRASGGAGTLTRSRQLLAGY